MTTFIYQPRAGLPFYATRPTPYVLEWGWANGCRHVVGGTCLSWLAAAPGRWWRDQAGVLARNIVRALGGVAWDHQGTVSVIVPTHHAHTAWEMVRAASHASGAPIGPDDWDSLANTASLVMSGAAELRRSGDHLVLRRGVADGLPSPTQPRYKDWEPVETPPDEFLALCEAFHAGSGELHQTRWAYASEAWEAIDQHWAMCPEMLRSAAANLAEYLRSGEPPTELIETCERAGLDVHLTQATELAGVYLP